jgi:hypothetical protein
MTAFSFCSRASDRKRSSTGRWCPRFSEPQLPTREGDGEAGPDDIDPIRLYRHTVLDLNDGHGRAPAQDLWHQTRTVRWQVLDDDKGHSAIRRRGPEKGGKRFETPR